jgi:hypothetical protein
MPCAVVVLEYNLSGWTPTRLFDAIDEYWSLEPTVRAWQRNVRPFSRPSP